MELKQNPFSLYDFLGYFTPGALFLYGCMAIYGHIYSPLDSLSFIATNLPFEKAEIYIPFILMAYTTGHLLSFLSSFFIEKYSEWSVGYPSKFIMGIAPKPYFYGNKAIRGAVAVFLMPISAIDYLLEKTISFRATYAKSSDGLLRYIISAKVNDLLRTHSGLTRQPKEVDATNTDFFRFAYHYAVENAPNHFPKMQNYVAIYGFLRTITFMLILLFWGMVVHIGYLSPSQLSFACLGLTVFLAFSFYLAFVKFYRRFSLEVLMALSAIYTVSKPLNPENAIFKGSKKPPADPTVN